VRSVAKYNHASAIPRLLEDQPFLEAEVEQRRIGDLLPCLGDDAAEVGEGLAQPLRQILTGDVLIAVRGDRAEHVHRVGTGGGEPGLGTRMSDELVSGRYVFEPIEP